MKRALRWLRKHWRTFGAGVVGLAIGFILAMRRRPTPAPSVVETARDMGRVQGKAEDLGDNLYGRAADLRARTTVAEERDAEAANEIREAARTAAAEANPDDLPKFKAVQKYLKP